MIAKPRLRFGMVRGEPSETYHADESVSRSKLDDFRRQPLYYWRKHVERSLVEEKPREVHFAVGQSSHALVLEGAAAYSERIVVIPGDAPRRPSITQVNAATPSLSTIKQIQWWKDFDAAAAGRLQLTTEEDLLNYRLLRSVREHPTASKLLEAGAPELTWRVQLKRFGIQCRSDWFNAAGCELTNGEPYVVDFKTVPSLDSEEWGNFVRSFFTYGYYRQGPFYNAVISEVLKREIKHFFFVVTEKKEPFETRVFRPADGAMELGWEEVSADLKSLAECYDTGVWPGSPNEILTVDVPEWYRRQRFRQLVVLGGAA